MSDLNNDVVEAIRKHLPAEVGSVLRGQLEELEFLRKDKALLEQRVKENEKQISKLTIDLSAHASLDEKLKQLTAREDAVEARERKLDVTVANERLMAETAKVALVKECFTLVFKNPVMQQSTFGSVPVNAMNGGYSNITQQPTSCNMTSQVNP